MATEPFAATSFLMQSEMRKKIRNEEKWDTCEWGKNKRIGNWEKINR